MSTKLDGKISNQPIVTRFDGLVRCDKCNKVIPDPLPAILNDWDNKIAYDMLHYIGQQFFIYESKSGRSVCYCSDYCRKKHNHRFKRGDKWGV